MSCNDVVYELLILLLVVVDGFTFSIYELFCKVWFEVLKDVFEVVDFGHLDFDI